MSTTVDLAHRPPSPLAVDQELELDQDLMAVLELLGREDAEAPAAVRPSLRRTGAQLLTWAQQSSRRAAAWGAVPAVPARPAATRSAATRSAVGIEGAR